MRRSCLALFCLTFAALLNGCSGSGGGSGGGSFSNAKWAAVLQPATFPAPLIELGMNFTQEGESISSGNSTSIINFGDCLIDDGELTSAGTVKNSSFKLVFSIGAQTVTLTGTIAPDGKTITGTFTSSEDGCLNGESGTFTANFVGPVTGNYTGTMTNGPNGISGVTAMLSQDENFNESATMTVTNNTCFSSLASAADSLGVSIGGFTMFDTTDGINTVSFVGEVNPDATEITGPWTAQLGCAHRAGVFQLNSGDAAAIPSTAGSGSKSTRPAVTPALAERMRAILAAQRIEAQTR